MQTFLWDGKITPRLGFGCGSMMGRVGRRDSLRAMHSAWDAGITLFDTARSYGYGEAEGLLGEFLAGRREKAIIVTKFGILPGKSSTWKRRAKPAVRAALGLLPQARKLVRKSVAGQTSPGHFDAKTMHASLNESLRQLRTDYVDVLLAHEAPASIMGQEDLIAAMQSIVSDGKARRAGISAIGHDVQAFASHSPAILSVFQYPAFAITAHQPDLAPTPLRIANHPLGGATYAKQLAERFARMAKDENLRAELREKLQGDLTERVAEFKFASIRLHSNPHIIVPSMLQANHLKANIVAIDSQRFTTNDLAAITNAINESVSFR